MTGRISKKLITFIRFFTTVKYLKTSQIFFRVFKIPKFIKVNIARTNETSVTVRNYRSQAFYFIEKENCFDGKNFNFLNDRHLISTSLWLNTNASFLWNYNLHYFDWLRQSNIERYKEDCDQLISEWITQNDLGCAIAWDPYPTSLRVVNWCKYFLLEKKEPCEALITSVTKQIKWLSLNLEWHILGNHLFANGKALIFYGVYFDGDFAQKVLDKGIMIISDQLKEQILDDGGHFERSPMYHNIILEDVLDIINMSLCYPDVLPHALLEELNVAAKKMLAWSAYMSHPDGGVPYFNDSVNGVSPEHSHLVKYARKIGLSCQNNDNEDDLTKLLDSGYLRYVDETALVLIDVGQVGPDYQPGHAHADTLSFEASIRQQRVFVNSGISVYALGSQRIKERGTAAHNTVLINNSNSSDVWSSFRVGRRAYPTNLSMEKKSGFLEITCSHDGYDSQPHSPKHFRKFYLERGAFTVVDKIEGEFHTASGYLHLHPDFDLFPVNENEFEVKLSSLVICKITILEGDPKIMEGFFCKSFGNRASSHSIKLDFTSNKTEFKVSY